MTASAHLGLYFMVEIAELVDVGRSLLGLVLRHETREPGLFRQKERRRSVHIYAAVQTKTHLQNQNMFAQWHYEEASLLKQMGTTYVYIYARRGLKQGTTALAWKKTAPDTVSKYGRYHLFFRQNSCLYYTK